MPPRDLNAHKKKTKRRHPNRQKDPSNHSPSRASSRSDQMKPPVPNPLVDSTTSLYGLTPSVLLLLSFDSLPSDSSDSSDSSNSNSSDDLDQVLNLVGITTEEFIKLSSPAITASDIAFLSTQYEDSNSYKQIFKIHNPWMNKMKPLKSQSQSQSQYQSRKSKKSKPSPLAWSQENPFKYNISNNSFTQFQPANSFSSSTSNSPYNNYKYNNSNINISDSDNSPFNNIHRSNSNFLKYSNTSSHYQYPRNYSYSSLSNNLNSSNNNNNNNNNNNSNGLMNSNYTYFDPISPTYGNGTGNSNYTRSRSIGNQSMMNSYSLSSLTNTNTSTNNSIYPQQQNYSYSTTNNINNISSKYLSSPVRTHNTRRSKNGL